MSLNLNQWRKLARAVACASIIKFGIKALVVGAILYFAFVRTDETTKGEKEREDTNDTNGDEENYIADLLAGITEIRINAPDWALLPDLLFRMLAIPLANILLIMATVKNLDLGQALRRARITFYLMWCILLSGIPYVLMDKGFGFLISLYIVGFDLLMMAIVGIFISQLKLAIIESKTTSLLDAVIATKVAK